MVFDLEPIPTLPITDLLGVGFLTGSRVFGGAKEDSDWDIVVPVTWRQEAEAIIAPWAYNSSPSHYFVGVAYDVHIGHDFHKINLIFVHVHEFKAWVLATEALEKTLPRVGLILKKERTNIFQTLMIQFRSILPELGPAKNYEEENDGCLAKAPYNKPVIDFCEVFGGAIPK